MGCRTSSIREKISVRLETIAGSSPFSISWRPWDRLSHRVENLGCPPLQLLIHLQILQRRKRFQHTAVIPRLLLPSPVESLPEAFVLILIRYAADIGQLVRAYDEHGLRGRFAPSPAFGLSAPPTADPFPPSRPAPAPLPEGRISPGYPPP